MCIGDIVSSAPRAKEGCPRDTPLPLPIIVHETVTRAAAAARAPPCQTHAILSETTPSTPAEQQVHSTYQ